MKISLNNVLTKAVVILFITVIVDWLGIASLVLKTVSMSFVPNWNIDNMSDYYTYVWESIKCNPVDNGRFAIIDVTENSRSEIADILATVNDMNPKVIGLDVTHIWKEDEGVDKQLVNTIQSINNIILPAEYDDKECKFDSSIFENEFAYKKYGVVSVPKNSGILRTFQPSFTDGEKNIDAFGLALAKAYGAEISNKSLKEEMLINYTTLKLTDKQARQGWVFLNLNNRDSVSFYRDSVFLASEISNRIVLIGSASDTRDEHLTPLGNMSGVMVHANIINAFIEGKNISTAPNWMRYLFCFIIAFSVLRWFEKHKSIQEKKIKLGQKILIFVLLFLISVVLFAGIGTILFCKFCYYMDFSPYIVTIILIYFFKDKELKFKKS